jgi:hypothetical protein
MQLVGKYLLPNYGWPHKSAGQRYGKGEQSFRQTISAVRRSDRGFCITYDKPDHKLCVSFDQKSVAPEHAVWLRGVIAKTGGGELNPQPYWSLTETFCKLGTKLHNCFFTLADEKIEEGQVYFRYTKIMKLSGLSIDRVFKCIFSGHLFVDFDARTGHNHGTKFRLMNAFLPHLYEDVEEI